MATRRITPLRDQRVVKIKRAKPAGKALNLSEKELEDMSKITPNDIMKASNIFDRLKLPSTYLHGLIYAKETAE